MLHRTWSYLLYLYGALISALRPMHPPAPLPASRLDGDQFPWQYLAPGTSFLEQQPTPAALETFAGTDSSVFHMGRAPSPSVCSSAPPSAWKSGACVPRSWIYLLKEGSTDLATEGRPGMRTELFSSKCPDTIIVQESDRDYQRIHAPAPPTWPISALRISGTKPTAWTWKNSCLSPAAKGHLPASGFLIDPLPDPPSCCDWPP
ncbi:unnamed protein product [Lepidochelys kempii]